MKPILNQKSYNDASVKRRKRIPFVLCVSAMLLPAVGTAYAEAPCTLHSGVYSNPLSSYSSATLTTDENIVTGTWDSINRPDFSGTLYMDSQCMVTMIFPDDQTYNGIIENSGCKIQWLDPQTGTVDPNRYWTNTNEGCPNLIINGTFENGTENWNTDSALTTYITGNYQVAVTTDPDLTRTQWASFGDHTSGSGSMLVSSNDTGRVWHQSVNLVAGKTYEFTGYFAVTNTSLGAAPFKVNFAVDGETVAAVDLSDGIFSDMGWVQLTGSYSATADGIHELSLNNNVAEMSFSGHDWAADDLSFVRVQTDADIQIDLTEYDFGEVELGSPSTMFVNIANTGEKTLTVNNIYLADTSSYNPFAVTAPSLPVTLPGGQSVDVEVSYNPSIFAAQSDKLVIESDDPDESVVEVALSGTGVASDNPSEAVLDILQAIETYVATGTLTGVGNGNSADNKLNAVKNMLESAGDLIDNGDLAKAGEQLESICKKVDGQPSPPDMLDGAALDEIAEVICQMSLSEPEPIVYGPADCLSAISANLTTSEYETVLNMIIEGSAQNIYQSPSSWSEGRPEGQFFVIEDDPYPYGAQDANMWINYLAIVPDDTSGTVSFDIDIFDIEGGPEQPIIKYEQQVSDTQAYEKCRGWIDTIPLNW